MAVHILIGDCLEQLRTLPDASAHCCVTSPPYFGLRDYGVAGQIGLEASPQAFVDKLVEVFREVRRVLRDDGTLWVNLGDSYASQGGPGWQGKSGERSDRRFTACRNTVGLREQARTAFDGFKPKDLMGMPWRVAFALQADGWYLRQDIIWAKPNPMPESVRDRCTKAHEYLFLLTKAERYYFDANAISEPLEESSIARLSQPNLEAQGGSNRVPGKTNGPMKAVGRLSPGLQSHKGTRACMKGRGEQAKVAEVNLVGTRNKRSVWTVATQPFKGAHFATFPPRLVEPCIKAGCPEGGLVLDPFGGAGTTGLVADRLQRDAVLIELNPEYADMAWQRIYGDAPLLTEIHTR